MRWQGRRESQNVEIAPFDPIAAFGTQMNYLAQENAVRNRAFRESNIFTPGPIGTAPLSPITRNLNWSTYNQKPDFDRMVGRQVGFREFAPPQAGFSRHNLPAPISPSGFGGLFGGDTVFGSLFGGEGRQRSEGMASLFGTASASTLSDKSSSSKK